MKSKIIEVSGIEVTCYEDGSIEKANAKTGVIRRQFGSNSSAGYMHVCIMAKKYYVHRLIAEAFLDNFEASMTVDHINGNKSCNDISNLREMSHSSNLRAFRKKKEGCSSEFRGVSWCKRSQKWVSYCQVDGKVTFVGLFGEEVEAALAWNRVALTLGYSIEAMNAIH